MNLRSFALTALTVAVATIAFPACAELVVNTQAPVSNQSQVQAQAQAPQKGVIEFTARPSNTVVRQPGSSSRPTGSSLSWNQWSAREASTSSTSTVDRSLALGTSASTKSQASAMGQFVSGNDVVASQGKVIEVGREKVSSGDLSVPVRGWADQVPLEMALSQVVPGDWSIQARGVDLKRPASWRGNKPWVEVLSDLTRQGKFNANVVWDRKVVVVFPVGSLDGTALAPLSTHSVVVGSVPAMVVPMAPTVRSWKIDPRLTLRGNVEAWAKQAGWNTVVWEAADYPIVAPAILEGEFSAPNGPLAKLIDAYRDSDQPLEVTLSTMDKVVHVTNKNFDAPTVSPLTPQAIVPTSFPK